MVIIFRDGNPIELTEEEVFDCYRAYRTKQDYELLKNSREIELCAIHSRRSKDEIIYDLLKRLDAKYQKGIPSDLHDMVRDVMWEVM